VLPVLHKSHCAVLERGASVRPCPNGPYMKNSSAWLLRLSIRCVSIALKACRDVACMFMRWHTIDDACNIDASELAIS